jgi:hypothetical protein
VSQVLSSGNYALKINSMDEETVVPAEEVAEETPAEEVAEAVEPETI